MALAPTDLFLRRHLGPSKAEIAEMLDFIGFESLDALGKASVPQAIQLDRELSLPGARGEHEFLVELKKIAEKNEIWRSYIGLGYHNCIVPPVIQRNILENPGWYTQYTPYQAEIAQGRLEALLNFQTMVSDLCGLPIANASLLDEGTAAAEAMTMCKAVNRKNKSSLFFVSDLCHPQTIEVVKTRAKPLGIEIEVGDVDAFDGDAFALLVQYPDTHGSIRDYRAVSEAAHGRNTMVIAATDLLALVKLTPPGDWGADVAVGNSQRFGVPMGYGGPHAAFLATRDEFKRQIPGRIIGISHDRYGNPALRMALQTREQHIRREKATSNICTAQVLLAIMAGMYGVYHGPKGLQAIADRTHACAATLATGLKKLGFELGEHPYFDTLTVQVDDAARDEILGRCREKRINLRIDVPGTLGVAVDEATTVADLDDLLWCFGAEFGAKEVETEGALDESLLRSGEILQHPVFHRYHAEHEMLRYLTRLQGKDLSLTTSMIPLGSCTMKLNGTSEMLPVTWAEFGALHPFVPADQALGYAEMIDRLEGWLAEITGFHAVSMMPNAGSQGEYTGMQVIRAYHESRGEEHRNVCLIPTSAHGTNPASAVMAGMKVVPIKCDEDGNIDMADLKQKAEKHSASLSSIMVTYPSTHGVFERTIREICDIVHEHGGQVYLDGANMNAQVGLCRPGDYGADVIHLNLHKTFCIPHGGGGPGMGPIGVAEQLAPFLPTHPFAKVGGEQGIGPVSAAPYGSPSILPISYVYIGLLGAAGLKTASEVAILNANYMAKRLENHYPVLYRAINGLCAHEFILDLRDMAKETHITVEDVAKRLMDYNFHAPTMAWPVAGTMMIEPTESESKEELDRLCDALITIKGEIDEIAAGKMDAENNPLKNAPHTAREMASAEWNHPYSREQACYPSEATRTHKFWPAVGRVDNVEGDRNLVCLCGGVEDYVES
ncbi:MAG: aminomethyl-transferring glycine dehydrogenase [Planctomycetota bacterium]|jgi:glycine dehydrogenase